MKTFFLAAGFALASATVGSAASFVATFEDVGLDVLAGGSNFVGATALNGTVAFESRFGDDVVFFSDFLSVDLTGTVVTDLPATPIGTAGVEGDFVFSNGFFLSAFDPTDPFAPGGDLFVDFLQEDLDQLVTAEAGDVLAFQPIFAFEDAVDASGDFFTSFFNGSGSVSFEVVEAFGEPAPVPLPASGLLLVGALGAARLLRKRKA